MADRNITSSENPLIKRLSKLHFRRHRHASGRFLIEGSREVSRAIAAGIPIKRAVLAPALLKADGRRALRLLDPSIERVKVPLLVFSRNLTRRDSPDGILVEALVESRSLGDIELPQNALVLVAESIEKPGNLGGILRSADAAGVNGVIVAEPATDLTNPNVIRASQGSVFAVTAVAANVTETLEFLATSRLRVIGMTAEASRELWEVDLTGAVAILVGSESEGLSSTFRAAGTGVKIPMRGAADSLNASVAAGMALYEAIRQRNT